jgi:hypothetical protein
LSWLSRTDDKGNNLVISQVDSAGVLTAVQQACADYAAFHVVGLIIDPALMHLKF